MKFEYLYHITSPKRAQKILAEGFDSEKNPTCHTPNKETLIQRIYLTKEKYLFLWIRVMARELKQQKIAILQLKIPQKLYKKFKWKLKVGSKGFENWGDQEFLQIYKPFKNGDLGIKIKLLGILNLEERWFREGDTEYHYS